MLLSRFSRVRLCNPMDCSLWGFSVHGILQARTPEWVAISFSNAWKWKVKVKSLSRIWLLATPWTAAYQAPPSMGFSGQQYWSGVPLPSPISINILIHKREIIIPTSSSVTQSCPSLHDWSIRGFPVHHQLPELAQTHVHRVDDAIQYLILCHPLLFLSSIFPSIRVFSNQSVLPIRWPKYWSLSFSISPSNEYSELISFRIDWFDLAVQGTLQHHSSEASILQRSAFFIVQLSHTYMTTGKNIALTRWIFVSKVRSLIFNMLSRLVIALLLRSKCLLILWQQLPSAVIWEPSVSIVSHLFAMKWWDQMPWS